MEELDLIIKNGRVFFGGRLVDADILVAKGKVVGIVSSQRQQPRRGNTVCEAGLPHSLEQVLDVCGKLVLPGTIDPHVHVRGPGFEEREDFLSGTSAAANGGVTTMIEQPLADPPPYSLEILERRISAATESAIVDVAFYGAAGADFPEKIMELADSGKIVAFKTFLHEAPEGRDSEFMGLTMKNAGEQYEGMKKVGESRKICGVHAENNDMIKVGIRRQREAGRVDGRAHALSRPAITEYETVSKLLLIAEETGACIEFCHISTPEAMEMIKQAKRRGVNVYLETCPHYLLMDESLLEEYGPYAKCNPPLRDRDRVEKLWAYINDGSVDFIGSDHAPYTYEEKKKGEANIFDCPAGIPCIEMRLPLMMDAVNSGKLSLARMVELLCTNPAKVFGLYPKKGTIQIGSDADFVIIDDKESYTVRTGDMYTKSRDSAVVFDGMQLKGRIKSTVVRGRVVMENGFVPEVNKGYGEFVRPLPVDESESLNRPEPGEERET